MADIYSAAPRCTNDLFSVGDCLDKLKAFNAVFEADKDKASVNSCNDNTKKTTWRKLVRDGVVNCGGNPVEYDFFEQISGSKTEFIDAKALYTRYNCDVDHNIFAQDAAVASGAGEPVTFTILKAKHSGGGKYTYPAEGYSIYLYEDNEWLFITAKNTTVDYGHTITAEPFRKSYTPSIRKNSKMLVMPVRLVNGLSCQKAQSTHMTPGYTNKVQPYRIRRGWCVPIDLLRGYEDILQFAIMFDENGKEVDSWDLYEKHQARLDMKNAKNLLFFIGQKIDNPTLLGSEVSADYQGFDGYLPTLEYGGGSKLEFDPAVGFDIEADFGVMILKNDALKRSNEFVVVHALPFMMGLQRNSDQIFKNAAGSCTFDTFKRVDGGVEKLGIDSYKWMKYTLHFKQMSALSDTRHIGNYNFPEMGIVLPGNGLRDSKGREVPSIEFYVPRGKTESGMMEEFNRDKRTIDGCEVLEGHVAETVMMGIHCVNQHLLLDPIMPCAA